MEDALALWHDLGSLLWFREHKELRSVVVLRPQWLADAFRCVITQRSKFAPTTAGCDGIRC